MTTPSNETSAQDDERKAKDAPRPDELPESRPDEEHLDPTNPESEPMAPDENSD